MPRKNIKRLSKIKRGFSHNYLPHPWMEEGNIFQCQFTPGEYPHLLMGVEVPPFQVRMGGTPSSQVMTGGISILPNGVCTPSFPMGVPHSSLQGVPPSCWQGVPPSCWQGVPPVGKNGVPPSGLDGGTFLLILWNHLFFVFSNICLWIGRIRCFHGNKYLKIILRFNFFL